MFSDGKPVLKHHYRGKQLSLWFDLIPKLSRVGDSRDKGHDLVDAGNISTFDDFPRLMRNFESIFPNQPPIPPPMFLDATSPDLDRQSRPGCGRIGCINVTHTPKSVIKRNNDSPPETSASSKSIVHTEEVISSVPLSITVAVGCSLLFLNIILFSAVYYQRRRIQRLNRRDSRDTNNEDSNNQGSPKPRSEHTDLKQASEYNTSCARAQDDQEKPNIQSNPLYSVICKTPSASGESSHRCSYESVSTDSSSPVRSNNKKNLRNNITPSLQKDAKLTSSKTNSPKPDRSKKDGIIANHINVKSPNSGADTVTVV